MSRGVAYPMCPIRKIFPAKDLSASKLHPVPSADRGTPLIAPSSFTPATVGEACSSATNGTSPKARTPPHHTRIAVASISTFQPLCLQDVGASSTANRSEMLV